MKYLALQSGGSIAVDAIRAVFIAPEYRGPNNERRHDLMVSLDGGQVLVKRFYEGEWQAAKDAAAAITAMLLDANDGDLVNPLT